MSTQKINIPQLRNHLKNFQFDKLFVESLGWEYPTGQISGTLRIKGNTIPYSCIAEKKGVPILKFDQTHFNNELNKKEFHKEIQKQHLKHLALFSDEKSFFSLSYLSKERQVRTHSYFKKQSGDYFISKLAGVHFGIEDEPDIVEIGAKLEKAFDTEKVTKRFFEDFRSNHNNFLKYISGIESKEERKWFASLILNRLMFIWFLQRKDFVDDDFNYLETKLIESKKRGKDRYYLEFLKLLFFEGFAKKPIERSEKARKLLGKIKYLNGGLFVPHQIEEKYEDKIKIQDKAFDETFDIFKKYDWYLQGKEGKSDNEISPDVMGYIFEKYINELQQKNLGAYYTKDEITSYLSRNTIQKCVLEKVNGSDKEYKFETIADMLHKLDTSLCKILLTEDDSILNNLTILDPAVGSGAFLVSAMKELIDIYSPIIGKIETLGDRELKNWLEDFKAKHKSVLYGIKKNIILKNLYGVDIMKEAIEVCKLRLFLSLVSSAFDTKELEPLPNMDFNIMCGNSLIGFLREEKQIKESEKQLGWDTVLGESYQQIKERYNKLVSQYKNKILSFEKLKELKHKISNFLDENNFKFNQILADKCNRSGVKNFKIKNIHGKKKITNKRAVKPEDFYSKDDVKNLKPFHWDFAFNKIINRGGFDTIITNPPWDKINLDEKEFFSEYNSSIGKKKTKTSEMRKIKDALLNEPSVKRNYYKAINFYSFQRQYFLNFYQCEINNKIANNKKSSAHMDNYRLFTERCFCLLNNNGFLGMVLPRGFYCDEGAIGLRKHIFNHGKIEGLITFVNGGKGKPIFEGVGSPVQFLFLNLKKDKPQDKFPCHFQEKDLQILKNFPEENSMEQSIKEIKELSPRDYSIIEFKNPKDKEILKKAIQFPKLGEIVKNLWNPYIYTEELNETRSSHLFSKNKSSKNFLPIYKGDNIHHYNYKFSNVNRYLNRNDSAISNSKKTCLKNKYYRDYRLVVRTIASTGDRKLISCIISKNSFIVNSLHGIYIENPKQTSNINDFKLAQTNSLQYILLLQTFLNSFIVDYFIKQLIYFNINVRYLNKLHIPRLTEKDNYFKELVERSAQLTCIGNEFNALADEIGIQRGGVTDQQERWKIQGEIDAMVAYVYGLTLDEFEYILSTFTTGKNQERLQTLKKYALEAFKKNQFLCKAG